MDLFETQDHDVKDSPQYYQTDVNPDPFVSPMEILRKRSSSTDRYLHKPYKVLKQNSVSQKDECAIYGEYIAEKLRKFDELSRAQAQHKINNVLFEIEMAFFKKTHYVEASTSQIADTVTFDNTLSPFHSPSKAEIEFDDEEDESHL